MESVPAVYALTRGSTNYARLCRLLVDVGCTILCNIFDSIHRPANLHLVLSNPSVSSTLQSLKSNGVLNPLQWEMLSPSVTSTVSSADFDASLLVILLTNICGLSPPVSTGSWDKLPTDSDNSTEANIVRIKCYRDEVFAYSSKASVDDPAFIALWQKISCVVLSLGSKTIDNAIYETFISQLSTAEYMDPDAAARYIKLLSEWKKNDDSSNKMLEEMKGMLFTYILKMISWGKCIGRCYGYKFDLD